MNVHTLLIGRPEKGTEARSRAVQMECGAAS